MQVGTFFKMRPEQEAVYIQAGTATCLCARSDVDTMRQFSTKMIRKVKTPPVKGEYYTLVIG